MHQITLNEFHKIWEQLTPSIDGMRDKSILITGATGLIGSYLIDFLIWANSEHKLNLEIFATSTSTDKLVRRFGNPPNMHFIECDLSQPWQTDEKFDFIIHGASPAHPGAYVTMPVETMQTNLVGTISLLNQSRKNNARFLFLSSMEVYGTTTETRAFSEQDIGTSDITNIRSSYPMSKRTSETLCISYANQYDVHVNMARLGYIYGPTMTNKTDLVIAQFLRSAANKTPIIMNSAGTQCRGWCYVADAVSGILYILLHGENMHAYNIANPNSVATICDVAHTLATIANVPVQCTAPNNASNSHCILNASKLISLGWRPLYNLETGLRHTLKITQDN